MRTTSDRDSGPREAATIRILGIDTSLRSTGVGVVDADGPRLRVVEYGLIRTPATQPLSECLRRLHGGINEIVERCAPAAVAVEGIFFSRNVRTAVILGEARGAVIAACAARGLPVHEYAPRRVKQAVVGFGGASKGQVGAMVSRLLSLRPEPPEDAADALAIAICHAHALQRPQIFQGKAI